jgi:hypothetical protein
MNESRVVASGRRAFSVTVGSCMTKKDGAPRALFHPGT